MQTWRSGRGGVQALKALAALAVVYAFVTPLAPAAAQHTGMTLEPEAPAAAPVLRWGWLLMGTYVLAGLVSAAVCCQMACSRRLSPAFWFGAGLATNVLALAAIMTRPKAGNAPPRLAKYPTTSQPAACPGCGALNHPAASGCLQCGGNLAAAYEPEKLRAGR